MLLKLDSYYPFIYQRPEYVNKHLAQHSNGWTNGQDIIVLQENLLSSARVKRNFIKDCMRFEHYVVGTYSI